MVLSIFDGICNLSNQDKVVEYEVTHVSIVSCLILATKKEVFCLMIEPSSNIVHRTVGHTCQQNLLQYFFFKSNYNN